jgi:hypothetical protein
VLVAWLAAANSPHRAVDQGVTERASHDDTATEDVSSALKEQSDRLRARLAQAPAPALGPRNPFTFAPPPAPPAARPARVAAAPAPAITTPLPIALTLMGIAEEPSPEGLHRTAIIGGVGEQLFMVMEGQSLADRYRVTAIGVDAVELKDLLTGGYRRLALR